MSCTVQATFLAMAICVIVVSFIYIFSWRYQRHTVEGVKLRLIGMFFAAMASVTLLQSTSYLEVDDLIPSLDIFTYDQFVDTYIIPMIITVNLFFGPILEKALDGCLFQTPTPNMKFQEKFRNFFFGPVIEEFTYRFLMVNLLLKCFSPVLTAIISAILFSLSHAHHHYVALIRDGECDWSSFGIHLVTTFIYGLYSSTLYIKVQSIISLSMIHAFCNWMGVPRIGRISKQRTLCLATLLGFTSSMVSLYFFIANDHLRS